MSTALGIAPDSDGNGTDPFTLRKIIQARWDSTGIVTGLSITRTTGLTYQVAAGVAVCSRSDSDGFTEAYYPGGTVTTTAGPSSGSRYDVVWIKADDKTQGDSDNLVTVGVTSGAAASSPSVPSLPTGALALGTFLVPQAMTATSSATLAVNAAYAIPFGVARGVLWQWTDTWNGLADQSGRDLGQTTVRLETDRWIRMSISPTISAVDNAHSGTCTYHLNMDWPSANQIVASFELDYDGNWVTSYKPVTVKVAKGTHKFWFYRYKRSGDDFYQHYGNQNGEFFPGTVFMVEDLGVAA